MPSSAPRFAISDVWPLALHRDSSASHLTSLWPGQIDRDEAIHWAESHGGHIDRVERRRLGGLGPSYGKREVRVTLIVPEEALYR